MSSLPVTIVLLALVSLTSATRGVELPDPVCGGTWESKTYDFVAMMLPTGQHYEYKVTDGLINGTDLYFNLCNAVDSKTLGCQSGNYSAVGVDGNSCQPLATTTTTPALKPINDGPYAPNIDKDGLKLYFETENITCDKAKDTPFSFTIYFPCDEQATSAWKPTGGGVMPDDPCSFFAIMPTSLSCPFVPQPSVPTQAPTAPTPSGNTPQPTGMPTATFPPSPANQPSHADNQLSSKQLVFIGIAGAVMGGLVVAMMFYCCFYRRIVGSAGGGEAQSGFMRI